MAKIIVDEKVCKGCGMCVHACPLKIIALDKSCLLYTSFNAFLQKPLKAQRTSNWVRYGSFMVSTSLMCRTSG